MVSILATHFFYSTPLISVPVHAINNSPLLLLYTIANHYSIVSATTGVAAMTDNYANAPDNAVMASVISADGLHQSM